MKNLEKYSKKEISPIDIDDKNKGNSTNYRNRIMAFIALTFLYYLGIRLLDAYAGNLSEKFYFGLEYDYRLPIEVEARYRNKNFLENIFNSGKSENWLQIKKLEDERLNKLLSSTSLSQNIRSRLKEKILETNGRAASSIKISRYYYKQFFVALSIIPIASVLTALSLFTIGKKGWDNSHYFVTTTFLVSFGFTSIFTVYMLIFKYESNIDSNLQIYSSYSALEDKITSYVITGEFYIDSSDANNEIINDPKKIIKYIDDQLVSLNKISIDFDPTKIPNHTSLKEDLDI